MPRGLQCRDVRRVAAPAVEDRVCNQSRLKPRLPNASIPQWLSYCSLGTGLPPVVLWTTGLRRTTLG